jgi:tryptophan synthase beta chain
MSQRIRFTLPQAEIPAAWYNLLADLPEPLPPPLHPATRQPVTPDMLTAIFPENLVQQEISSERWIEIPEPVREIYALWRPTPLLRAVRLEKALQTPAHIYYKYEGVSPAGSHKPNTAVAQAFYNRQAGTRRLATETGAGQWGSSLAFACRLFGLECVVYMVKVSFQQKPYRKLLMQTWGATVHASPSDQTEYGRRVLREDPNCPGSLGIAISEAIEDTVKHPGTKYSLGSVLNHVCLHQTVIGQEALKQMEMAGEEPDVVIACVGGGSNFAGLAFPFVHRKLTEKKQTRIVAVEPTACASLTKGELRYDFGDTAEMTPLLMMYTLGHKFIPPKIHAGGLRYHGMAPLVSHLKKLNLIEAVAYPQTRVFEAAILFARTEGIVPAPEPSHAIAAAVDEAIRAREEGKPRVILFNLCGHGLLDLSAYDLYLSGQMKDTDNGNSQTES